MLNPSSTLVTNIRSVSRDLVRELGFMHRTLAGTDLSPSAVHAIIEIGTSGQITSKTLSETLLLEKSTVSRLVRSLIEKGEIREARSEKDARSKPLRLTAQGEATLSAIANFAGHQVAAAMEPLADQARQAILSSLRTYSAALKASRTSSPATPTDSQVDIKQGYTPCMIGRIVELHASYYSKLVGFGVAFEAKVASDLAEFVTRLEKTENAIWYAQKDNGIVGCIAIDGEDLGSGKAHLRWFIVGQQARGSGVGKSLIRKALAFCDRRNFCETHLWTFKGLDAARSLYESHGFDLAEECYGAQWGKPVLEQRFVRKRQATPATHR